jgi:ribosomal-protein-alanine N-acetyltransferase
MSASNWRRSRPSRNEKTECSGRRPARRVWGQSVSEVIIRTERLELVLESTAEILARVEAMSPSDRAQVSPDWLARVRASTAADPWTHGFIMVDRASGAMIGSCGYKGPPDSDGTVEIAYGVDPVYQGRGYATEAAMGMVGFAFGSGEVRLVRAHTLPQASASTRVLTKCGFHRVGEVVDPEDGLVWQWERASPSSAPPS